MNIFVTDECPIQSAIYLDDKRLVKMCLETAQLLSSAIIINGGTATYRVTHKNHPCTKWAATNVQNFLWLCRHGYALCEEYQSRFNKIHKCLSVIDDCYTKRSVLPYSNTMTPFANCTTNKAKGISFKDEPDTIVAYRKYLQARWDTDKSIPKWTGRYNGTVTFEQK